MKKLTSLFLILAMLMPLALSGCGKSAMDQMIENYKNYDSTGEEYDCYLPDYIEIPDFTVVEVPNLTYVATDEILDNRMKRDMAVYAADDIENFNKPAKEGDIAEIMLKCWVDGEEYSLYTLASTQSIVLGCYEMDMKIIDEMTLGMLVGEKKTFEFTFPDPFYKDIEMSGKKGVMELSLEINTPVIYEEMTDEFFLSRYSYNMADHRASLKTKLEEQYNGYIETYKSDIVWEYIYENTKVKAYPKDRDELYDSLYDDYRTAAQQNDMTFAEFIKGKHGFDSIEQFEEYLNGYVDDYCKKDMILYFIARANNLQYTQEYYEAELLAYCEEYEIKTIEEAESFVDFQFGLDLFKERCQLNYVYEWIGNSAVLREDVTTYVNDLNKELFNK